MADKMKVIESRGRCREKIFVDEDTYAWASQMKWHISTKHPKAWVGEGKPRIYLARKIMGLEKGDERE